MLDSIRTKINKINKINKIRNRRIVIDRNRIKYGLIYMNKDSSITITIMIIAVIMMIKRI